MKMKYTVKGILLVLVMVVLLMATAACANCASSLGDIIGGGTETGTGEGTVLTPIAMLLENLPEGDLYIDIKTNGKSLNCVRI